MNIAKKFVYGLFLFAGVVLLVTGEVSAGIKNSPHDIIQWQNKSSADVSGTCAYCHVPHSSKGDRLFPASQVEQKNLYDTLGAICFKCHGVSDYLGTAPYVFAQIFETLDTTKSDSTMDSHPVKGTSKASQPNTLQNTSLDSAIGATVPWPWINDKWKKADGGKGDANIQCTTCHNPHNWNTNAFDSGAQRKFLRAPVYDSAASIKNFCSYCHKDREDSTNSVSGNAVYTHPVSSGGAGVKLDTAAHVGLYLDTNYMFQYFRDSASLMANPKDAKAIWDWRAAQSFLGARLYGATKNQVICQSCHMPHGVMHSNDDVYSEGVAAGGTDTAELKVGPLLAINNATSLLKTGAPSKAPAITNYPIKAESTYCLPSGSEQSLLCEWCHGMTPSLNDASESTGIFAHPVNKYPTSTADDIPFETAEYGMTIRTKYPPATWLKYRESGGIRKAGKGATINTDLPDGTSRPTAGGGQGYYLVCLSCHEPHQADTTNGFLLKKGSGGSGATAANGAFCSGCHRDYAMGSGDSADTYFTTWTTHPSGPNARLYTRDSNRTLKLPNRAGLRTFDAGTNEYISCWTCHKAHKGVEKPLLTDYQRPFSQICVNCHCPGETVNSGSKATWATTWTYASTNANPSLYYKEGAWDGWWNAKAGKRTPAISSEFVAGDVMRLGSHYIGKFTGAAGWSRPLVGSAGGWLGERDTTRVAGSTVNLKNLDHSQGSLTGVAGEAKDKWLDTSSPLFVDTGWSAFTGGSGSNQKSHVGDLAGTRNVIICQSCHAVHNSAKGVADDSTVSRLLLASNYDSYMCKRCHIPEVKVGDTTFTHPMHADVSGGSFKYNTAVGRTGTTVNNTNNTFAYVTVYAPANYPYDKLNCDACHSVHNADSKMGAMIVEGDSAVYPVGGTGIDKIDTTYLNKVPVIIERNDKPTCDLCHKQGTASE